MWFRRMFLLPVYLYVFDFGSRQELLEDVPFELVAMANMMRPVLCFKRQPIFKVALKTWRDIVTGMLDYIFYKGGRR
jgi:hypothetical protein